MSIATKLEKLTTDITNAYTSIENKGGTIPANKNTENMSTAIDSIEVIEQTTAEGESLSLTNTKAMPYNDFVVDGKSEQEGEPSPSNPSEIHSVADDVNLFNEPKVLRTAAGLTFTYNNKKIKLTGTAGATYFGTNNISQNIKAGTYTFSSTNTNSNLTYNMWLYNSSNQLIGNTKVNNPVTISEDATYYVLFVEGLTNGTTYNEEVNVKLQKGTVATPYSPYNQGTVTIKQRGKNLLNVESIFALKGSKTIDLDLEAGSYTLSLSNWSTTGGNVMSQITFNYIDGTTLNVTIWSDTRIFSLTFTKKVTSVKIFSNTTDGNSGAITTTYTNLMLEKGSQATDYEPYQGYDKVFQTEPLRSLPNGVKDTIEADGIHRRVGRVVLDGTENWTQNSTYQNVYLIDNFLTDADTTETRPMLSDYFQYGGLITQGSSTVEIGKFYQWTSLPQRLILGYNSTSLNDFKVWLSNNLVTILYPLATEVIEPLTQNQATTMLDIIKTGSYEGTTNIYTDEDVKPTIKADYYKKK